MDTYRWLKSYVFYVLLENRSTITLCHLNNFQVFFLDCSALSFLDTGSEIVLVLLALGYNKHNNMFLVMNSVAIYKYANDHTFLRHSFGTQPSPCVLHLVRSRLKLCRCLQVGLALYKHHGLYHIHAFIT